MCENNIPKIIHYCWFGKTDKPKLVRKCIESWKEILTDYKIIEWNESNFDINMNEYVKEAYEMKKYAFVSDFVRVYALYNMGGIYLDTDVKIFKSFNDLLQHESFWGFEMGNRIATSTIGAKKENKLIKLFLDSYNSKKFILDNGDLDTTPNVCIITDILIKNNLLLDGRYQEIESGVVYPKQYFSPYDYINCYSYMNESSYCIHYFYKSWLPVSVRIKSTIKKILASAIGENRIAKIREKFSNIKME